MSSGLGGANLFETKTYGNFEASVLARVVCQLQRFFCRFCGHKLVCCSWFPTFFGGDVLHRLKLCDFGMSKKFKVHSLAVMLPSFPTYVMQLYRRPERRQPDKTVGVLNKVQIMDAELMGSKSMVPSPSNKYTWQMGAPWSRGVRGFPLAMVFATVLPALRARNAFSLLEHHFLQTVQPHGRPGWLTAAGSLMGPGAIAMSNLLEGELKAYNTSSNSTVESFRIF